MQAFYAQKPTANDQEPSASHSVGRVLTFSFAQRIQDKQFASGAFWKLNREAGENPARPRHCDRGGLAIMPLTVWASLNSEGVTVGKAASPMKRESGDLPEVG